MHAASDVPARASSDEKGDEKTPGGAENCVSRQSIYNYSNIDEVLVCSPSESGAKASPHQLVLKVFTIPRSYGHLSPALFEFKDPRDVFANMVSLNGTNGSGRPVKHPQGAVFNGTPAGPKSILLEQLRSFNARWLRICWHDYTSTSRCRLIPMRRMLSILEHG